MSTGNNVMQRFEVEPVDGKKNTSVATYNKEKGGFDYTVEKKDFGYMVYFPQGHSIRVSTKEELRRLGFDRQPGLVNMEDGEEVQPDMSLSPKAVVQRNTKTRPKIEVDDDE